MAQSVFVIDDNEDIRDTLRLLLEEAGYAVRDAADGLAGLAVIRATDAPSVVLLDMLMPKLDGVGVLRAIAQAPDHAPRHRYILLSAGIWRVPHEISATLAVTVVPKPFDVQDLLDIVAREAAAL
jgi:CheY-like chemotaxis protein